MENKQLKYIDLTLLEHWSVQGLLDSKFDYSNKYGLAKIGDFLIKSRMIIDIEDDKMYNRVTVRTNNNGVTLRDTEKGVNIGTKKQYIATSGQFIVSKIDARNGAFGIIPKELDNAIVTNDFPLFDVDTTKINPQFLLLITTTKAFVKFAQSCSSGTTNRQRMDIDMFLNQKIPLPTIEEQNSIVNDYQTKISEAERLEQEVRDLEGEIGKYLLATLDIQTNTVAKSNNLFQLINFDETTRWDILFLSGKIPIIKSKYDLVSLSEIITSLNTDKKHKSLRFDSNKSPNSEFRYLGMEHVEKETGKVLEMPIVKGDDIKSQTVRVPPNYIVYGKLRPYLNKYWINNTEFNNIICSSEFFVFDINENINKLFFVYVLASKIIQDQIADKTSGARMPRINESTFLNLRLPLPSIEVQNEVAHTLSGLTNRMEKTKQDIAILKIEALQDFEKLIFQ